MIVVNFSHPLTDEQQAQLEAELKRSVDRVIEVRTHLKDDRPFAEQVQKLVEQTGLTAEEWQTLPLVINLPSYSAITAVLLAHLHGMMGHFPTVIRLQPCANSPVPRYDLAEIIPLDRVRHDARITR